MTERSPFVDEFRIAMKAQEGKLYYTGFEMTTNEDRALIMHSFDDAQLAAKNLSKVLESDIRIEDARDRFLIAEYPHRLM